MSFAENVRRSVAKQWDIPVSKGDCGIEIEIEGENLPQAAITKCFVGKGDGSLRHGAEYVSYGAIPRANVDIAVTQLRQALEKVGARFQPSYRCSTHIHEDYTNGTFHDVLGAFVVWALVEPVMFRAIPAGRDGSLFCVPSYDSGDVPAYIDRFCKEINDNFRRGFNPRGKYASQNITRLGPGEHHALGTLENRIFPYTMDGEIIQTWCDWLGNIKKIVSEAKDETFLSLVRWAEKNPVVFLERVFGKPPVPLHDAPSLVDFGARQAYEIARVINAAYKLKPSKEEPKTKKPFFEARPVEAEALMQVIDDVNPPQPAPAEVAPAQPVNPFPPRRAPGGRVRERQLERRLREARAVGDAGRAERTQRELNELRAARNA